MLSIIEAILIQPKGNNKMQYSAFRKPKYTIKFTKARIPPKKISKSAYKLIPKAKKIVAKSWGSKKFTTRRK